MGKHRKTEAERIQLRISQRLTRMKGNGLAHEDFQFLWDWTHTLYKLAADGELRAERKLSEVQEYAESLKRK
jgi:hypothetical protein